MRANAQSGSGKESEVRRERALRVTASQGQLCPAGRSGSITLHICMSLLVWDALLIQPNSCWQTSRTWAKVHASFNC